MRINSPESYYEFQVYVAQRWRDEHHLPRIPDTEAVYRHYGVHPPKHRMNSPAHIARLLRVWELWKRQSKQSSK